MELNASYWNERYRERHFPWDLGKSSQPISTFISGLADKELQILVPGAGNGHEVMELWRNGFRNTWILDWADLPVRDFLKRNPDFPEEQALVKDFFDHAGAYDLILEQTFFCALPPVKRLAYVRKMGKLIKPGGKLAGLLFDFPLSEAGPPFGGSEEEYRSLFAEAFNVLKLERCLNSDPGRAGMELWMELMG